MRRTSIPVDMSSEQKSFFGIASNRQLAYVGGGGIIIYNIGSFAFKTFSNVLLASIIAIIVSLPIIAFVVYFGFMKNEKYFMNNDQLWITKFGYVNQIGVWRRGGYSEPGYMQEKEIADTDDDVDEDYLT